MALGRESAITICGQAVFLWAPWPVPFACSHPIPDAAVLIMQVKLTLGMSRRILNPSLPLEVECDGCGIPLDIHQPDPNRPDRLLGTCEACGNWVLIVADDESNSALLVRLPEAAEITKQTKPPPSQSVRPFCKGKS